MIEKTALLKEMFDIHKDIPSTMEYETDARDVWPKRWETLFRRIRDWPDDEVASTETNGSSQIFEITRAPEEPPLTARELHKLLWAARPKSEWGVREIAENGTQKEKRRLHPNCRRYEDGQYLP